ncbi:putative acyl-CoA dehydrogenase FadE [Actinomadura rubrobrunea]|uniref:Acyl-CoA dehydrogenase FadE n=1 Tax=Actinomadura rubrobrunea TaxID=115335 RepID=A0A9W6UZD3_9ACTN|nr:acyl-CoA dehydrogenase family protein [Actinomadura rubrobrunea]GLW66650.1 putative acyl-CoA dehydrogenase FadE [Actinomadura rubrobrunea]
MRFVLDAEQRLFAETLDKLLAEADTPAAIRAWAAGDAAPGRALWRSLAETGVFALAVPESHGGAGTLPVELVTAAFELGRHAVPGPFVETLAGAALIGGLGDDALAAAWLPRVAAGDAMISLARPYALDADVADLVVSVAEDDGPPRTARPAAMRCGVDPARRLFEVRPDAPLAAGPDDAHATAAAVDLAALLCAAQQLGVGRALLDASVEYAKTRRQFGRAIGEFQAVKHHLANALVHLEFARPLVYGAALSYGTAVFPRDVSAAKAAAAEASYMTAKTALQVHGAIAYTDEYAPSLWIRKARALYSAWGAPAAHRARVLSLL